MKKNKMMRLASVLLVLTLLSTSVISGTFAKYTTQDSASDTARVAKWGVTVVAGGNLFGKNYEAKTQDGGNQISASVQYSVDTSDTDKIVAPGTKSDKGMTISVKGEPEVKNTIVVTTVADANKDIFLNAGTYGVLVPVTGIVTAENVKNYYVASGNNYTKATALSAEGTVYYELHDKGEVTATENGKYLPIIWTVTKVANSTGTLATTTYKTVAAMYTAISTELASTNNANDVINDDYIVSWEWAFENQDDDGDTILGNIQAAVTNNVVVKLVEGQTDVFTSIATSDYSLNVGFDITITATQDD